MAAVQQFILCYDVDKDRAQSIVSATAKELEHKQTTLIEVVQSLGAFINDEDSTKRDRATEYLSRVAAALPTGFLARQQVQVLNQFFCDRVEDPPALGGMKQLLKMERYSEGMATMTFRAIIENSRDLQMKTQPRRLQVLDLVSDLMSLHRAAMKSLNEEAIIGITDLVSNEKDPRNLMVVFSILRVLMTEWDITDQAEVLFDAVFCYFPITFRPPPDDPYHITAQDLKDRLRQCIAVSGHFAPYAFPQLLEKLDSTSANVKRDVMQTLRSCCMSYGAKTVSSYSITLFDAIQYEVWNAQEEDLAQEALRTLQSVAVRLGQGLVSTDPKTPLALYLRAVTKECNERIQEPQHKQAKAAGQLLSILGTSSPTAYFLVIKYCFPPLSTLYQAAESIPKQKALLEILVLLLDSAIATYGTLQLQAPETSIENPLKPFKERMFELTTQALMSTAIDEISFRIVALKALLRLCLLRKYLEESEVGLVVQFLDEIILTEDPLGREDLKSEAIRSLVELSRVKPNLIMSITFPAFMARLPETIPTNQYEYILTLEGLAQLSVDRLIADTLIRRLLNRLDLVLPFEGSPAYAQAILSTMNYVLARRDLKSDLSTQFYLERIVVGLSEMAVKACTGKASYPALCKAKTLEVLAQMVNLIIKSLDHHKQQSMASQCYSLFVDKATFVALPFRSDVAQEEKTTLILSTGILGAVSSEVKPEFLGDGSGAHARLLRELARMSIPENDPAIRHSILRQIGLVVNKFAVKSELAEIEAVFVDLTSSLPQRQSHVGNAVRSMFWIAKSLVLRLAALHTVLDRLLFLLDDRTYGAAVARGFGLLLAPDEVLSKENGAQTRPLARQKAFSTCMPIIAKRFSEADASVKSNYLVAVSGLLKHVPTSIIVGDVDTLLPLLLQSLELKDTEVKAATIKSLAIISHESPATMEGHIGSVVKNLLKSTSDPHIHGPAVRLHALLCLKLFPGKIKESTLLSYRSTVERGLSAALDDPRRDIRKEAVACRSVWLDMDEPQSD